ncbi:poly [ADP-ribose] polymerase 2 [Folsomia candida]|uniref:Poly [ADP-ribose] polymerase n=1 Tax=Folsomia candida TaxID=158441 RepID=A0A226E6B4_FOLCA|nr:poly [ADP-ribose] polymerase 2 [Folsomia candida]OXA52116.1 Poly [ADP-ribose] polymerase 2 [Folsomia candida]
MDTIRLIIIRLRKLISGTMSSSTSESDEDDLANQFKNLSTKHQGHHKTKGKPIHEPASLQLLQQITGKSETELKTYLFKAQLLTTSHENYTKIVQYVRNSQEHGFGIQVVNIVRLVRNNDFEFQHEHKHSSPSTSKTSNFRMILWHGTKKNSVSAILSNGFAKPPNKNQMFGTGCYFADRASKSANYCDGTTPGKLGYMFLCDVKLGKMYKAKNPHNDYSSPPSGYDTVKCVGAKIPDWDTNQHIDGAVLPSGPTRDNLRFGAYSVNFNEYVVYTPERIKAKYLVVVKFQAQKC